MRPAPCAHACRLRAARYPCSHGAAPERRARACRSVRRPSGPAPGPDRHRRSGRRQTTGPHRIFPRLTCSTQMDAMSSVHTNLDRSTSAVYDQTWRQTRIPVSVMLNHGGAPASMADAAQVSGMARRATATRHGPPRAGRRPQESGTTIQGKRRPHESWRGEARLPPPPRPYAGERPTAGDIGLRRAWLSNAPPAPLRDPPLTRVMLDMTTTNPLFCTPHCPGSQQGRNRERRAAASCVCADEGCDQAAGDGTRDGEARRDIRRQDAVATHATAHAAADLVRQSPPRPHCPGSIQHWVRLAGTSVWKGASEQRCRSVREIRRWRCATQAPPTLPAGGRVGARGAPSARPGTAPRGAAS